MEERKTESKYHIFYCLYLAAEKTTCDYIGAELTKWRDPEEEMEASAQHYTNTGSIHLAVPSRIQSYPPRFHILLLNFSKHLGTINKEWAPNLVQNNIGSVSNDDSRITSSKQEGQHCRLWPCCAWHESRHREGRYQISSICTHQKAESVSLPSVLCMPQAYPCPSLYFKTTRTLKIIQLQLGNCLYAL